MDFLIHHLIYNLIQIGRDVPWILKKKKIFMQNVRTQLAESDKKYLVKNECIDALSFMKYCVSCHCLKEEFSVFLPEEIQNQLSTMSEKK